VPDVIAQESHREYPAAVRTLYTRRGMQGLASMPARRTAISSGRNSCRMQTAPSR
jgi:hypothetical protein